MNFDRTTPEEAAHWFAVLRRGPMSLEERQAFDGWRAQPLNQRALDQMHELWGELSALKTVSGSIRRDKARGARRAVAAAAVLALSVGVGGGLWLKDHAAGKRVATRIGQQQTMSLSDGSVVALNVVTSVSYKMKPTRRSVDLKEGEAAFFVRKDRTRPFLVDAGDYQVRAVGTAFNVRRRDGLVDVAVGEGVVSVKALRGPRAGSELARLVAGQRLRLVSSDSGAPIQVTTVPVQSVAEWRLRVVDYQDVSVETIAADLSRFYERPIVIADPDLARRRVTLRLQVADRDQTLRVFSSLLAAKVVRGAEDDALVLNASAGS